MALGISSYIIKTQSCIKGYSVVHPQRCNIKKNTIARVINTCINDGIYLTPCLWLQTIVPLGTHI